MTENSMERQFSFSVLLSLIGVVIALWLLKYFWEKRNFFKVAALIPDRAGRQPFDLELYLVNKPIHESFNILYGYFAVSPEVFKVWWGPLLVVGISKPDHIEEVCTNAVTMNKSSIIEFTSHYMGEGLFSAPVDVWRRHRKLINPSFNQKILNSFIPIFAEKCDILIGILEKMVGQPNIDIVEKLSGCTLDTICESAMGLNVNAQTASNRYGRLLDKAMELITKRIFNLFYYPQIIYDMTNEGKEFKKVVEEMNVLSQEVITKQKEKFQQKMRGDYIDDPSHIKTFLELLMEISHRGDHFTNKQLQDEVNTFIAAGSDTTSVAMSFCCLTFGMNPEYQQKVYEEAIEVLGEDRYPTQSDLPKLKLLEMFIKETLRIFPVAPFIVRIASGDIKLDDLILPKDSIILVGLMHLHRNPKYWEDPLKFNPYRFLPEEWAKKHAYSHLPFSGGPRGCIGSKYAMMIMKVILSKIVRKFRIKSDYKSVEEVELKINLMARPFHGFKVSLENRDGTYDIS